MVPGVTAILVARDGDAPAERAVMVQSRSPDSVIVIAAGSSLARAVTALPDRGADEWLWFLPGDARPEADALARLLGAVEVAPSVVIAGPKLVDLDDRSLIRSFGESMTRYGATVPLADDELDQSQHDVDDDVLGVALPGALVRRSAWEALGGVDPGLPSYDAGLDLSVRARLSGSRVVRVAGARVAVADGAQDFLRRRPLAPAARPRVRRAAQLHRRMAYAPGGVAVALHWLSLLPLAVIRSIGLLLGKRPGEIPGEVAAALRAIFDGSIRSARAALRRTRRVGWPALATLRIPPDVVRERRASARERALARSGMPPLVRAAFLPGGLIVVLAGAVVGTVLALRVLGAGALDGGALLPLADSAGDLWSTLGWGSRDGLGLEGPADPFAAVLAVLGSLTPWNPSTALVALWVAAPAIGGLGAWWCATRLSTRAWPPALAGVLWIVAPPLLAALVEGRPAAVLVHALLPWLLLAVLEAPRSWSAAGAAGLLFAAVGASSPSLVPALVVGCVGWALARPRSLPRVLAIPLPLLVLSGPLIAAQIARGTPAALLADPGAVVPFPAASGWQLLLGVPAADADGWGAAATALSLPAALGSLAPVVLLSPLAVLVLLAIFLPGSRTAALSAGVALGGLLTAVAAAHLSLTSTGPDSVAIWPGAALSLYWAGLIGAAVAAVHALRRAGIGAGAVVVGAAALAVVPFAVAAVGGAGAVVAGTGRSLPAIVVAEASGDPALGTLVLRPEDDGTLSASVERGAGSTLDSASTFAATRPRADAAQQALAELAGNLASRGGYEPGPELGRLGIEFVLLAPSESADAETVRQRAAEALDAQPALDEIGDTTLGSLWRNPDHEVEAAATTGSPLGGLALTAQGAVFAFALLLALPTGPRRRREDAATVEPESTDPEGFDEDALTDAFAGDYGDEDERG